MCDNKHNISIVWHNIIEACHKSTCAWLPKLYTLSHTLTHHQIRLMGGKVLTHQFEATSTLSDVQRFIESQTATLGDAYLLMTSFPKHIFTGEDESKTLRQLGAIINTLQ